MHDIPADLDASERRLWQSIPADIHRALTPAQMLALLAAVKPVPVRHALALRASFRGLEKRYYTAFFFGEDGRNIERLRAEGQLDAIPVGVTFFVLIAALAAYGLVPLLFLVYMVKSMLGLDLMDGPSPIHTLICG